MGGWVRSRRCARGQSPKPLARGTAASPAEPDAGPRSQKVRAAALAALADAAPRAGPELRRASLLPLVRRHMQPLELEPPVQRALAGLFPALVDAVRGGLPCALEGRGEPPWGSSGGCGGARGQPVNR